MAEPYTCAVLAADESGKLKVPNHRLISGSRVIWRGSGQAGCFLVENRFQQSGTLSLLAEQKVGIAALELIADSPCTLRALTSSAHGLKYHEDVLLHRCGALPGMTFSAEVLGEFVLELRCSSQSEDILPRVTSLLTAGLQGDETMELPCRTLKSADMLRIGNTSVLQHAPRAVTREAIEASWIATLSRRFPAGRPAATMPELEFGSLVASSCGTAACLGTYHRDKNACGDLRFINGCVSLSFERCLGLWILAAQLKPLQHERLWGAREALKEPDLQWEGPQLLYVCGDSSPTGPWFAVFGEEPVPVITRSSSEQDRLMTRSAFLPKRYALGSWAGPWRSEILSLVLSTLLCFRDARWRTFVELSHASSRGPRGESGASIAQKIFGVVRQACTLARVCRTWHAGVTSQRKCWQHDVEHVVQVPTPSRAPLKAATLIMLARIGSHAGKSILPVTEWPDFKNAVWGAALESIDWIHHMPEGGRRMDSDDPADFSLVPAAPAMYAFARELFSGVAASWEGSMGTERGVPSFSGYREGDYFVVVSEHMQLLTFPWCRPEQLRGQALVGCKGADGVLLSPDGAPLVTSRLPGAIRKLRSTLVLLCPGLGPVEIELVDAKQGWSSKSQKKAIPCFAHRLVGLRTGCAECDERRGTPGWSSLAATFTLSFSVVSRNGDQSKLDFRVLAPVVPFVSVTTDRRLGKLPSKVGRAQLKRDFKLARLRGSSC
eukprot:TRINITY_DN48743_c0_g1_i1.p1 TRINITY_DN48743_c0_g1~~TRINITY_DN48743_c0_g1_i1.p1  ORF type:complete len:721 (+),score=35.37 TRINITY_DN48743_c0_g1_i1:116-2278(+)